MRQHETGVIHEDAPQSPWNHVAGEQPAELRGDAAVPRARTAHAPYLAAHEVHRFVTGQQGELLRSDESGAGGHVGHRSLRCIHWYCVQRGPAVTDRSRNPTLPLRTGTAVTVDADMLPPLAVDSPLPSPAEESV